MAAEAEEVPLCGLHHLKFVELKEFPEDTPDFSDVLGSYASNRCKARACRRDGTLNRVPLCAEDVIATGMEDLFDEDGYCIGLCSKHAELVLGRAVEGRACTGTICSGHASGEGEDSHISNVSQPQCGRVRVGSRIYCETCDMVRVETGKTPMKPVRAVRGPPTPVSASSFVDAGEQVSPLTEAGGSGGGSGMLRQAAGMIGAALSAAQGTGAVPSTVKSAVHGAANLAAVERFGDAGASPDSSTAPAGGSPGLVMRGGSSGMEMDRLLDVLGSVKDQLGRLERRQFESEASIMKQLASAGSLPAVPAEAASAPQLPEQGGAKGLESARKMGVDVMAKLRGGVEDADPTAPPPRRLGALMRPAANIIICHLASSLSRGVPSTRTFHPPITCIEPTLQ